MFVLVIFWVLFVWCCLLFLEWFFDFFFLFLLLLCYGFRGQGQIGNGNNRFLTSKLVKEK